MDAELSFGQRLSSWRKSKKMTQAKLAKASGMHRVAIANIESGHRGKSPEWDTIRKLSEALGISAEQLTSAMPVQEMVTKPTKLKTRSETKT